MTHYQPLYRARRDDGDYERESARRYTLITPIVRRYRRPITVLDLGANLGYFGLRLADDYGAVSVMIDPEPSLLTACAVNNLPTTVAMQRTLTHADLERLADCEHFDVVLGLNVLHHFPDPRRALAAVLRMGEQVILETPGQGEGQDDLLRALIEQAPVCLGYSPSHRTPGVQRPMFHFARPKPRLEKSAWGSAAPVRDHAILSLLGQKLFDAPDKQERREWFPGINLWTFLSLGGGWPIRHEIEAAVLTAHHTALSGFCDVPFGGVSHGDVRPWNFILSGDAVTLIDWNDPQHAPTPDASGLQLTLRAVRSPSSVTLP